MKRKFPVGRVLATPAALEAMEESGQQPAFFLDQHCCGDWGNVCPEDRRANDEALVTELTRAGIAVKARQSVLQYRDTDKPVRQIASELGVDALIQPTVGREGDSVVVDVSILEASSELPIFTETFASRVQGVLGLYRAVSAEIADAIGAVLSEEVQTRLAERPTVDPQVTENVLLGRSHLRRFTPQDFDLA